MRHLKYVIYFFILAILFPYENCFGNIKQSLNFLKNTHQHWETSQTNKYIYTKEPFFLLLDDKLLPGFQKLDEIGITEASAMWQEIAVKENYTPARHNITALSFILKEDLESTVNQLIKQSSKTYHADPSQQMILAQVQKILQILGYYDANIDGRYTQETGQAITTYCKHHSLQCPKIEKTYINETINFILPHLIKSIKKIQYYENINESCLYNHNKKEAMPTNQPINKNEENSFNCLVAALNGNGAAWIKLSSMKQKWFNTQDDFVKILLLAQALDAEEGIAAAKAATILLKTQQLPRDPELIFNLLLSGSQLKDSKSMYLLGQLHDEYGLYEINQKESNKWYEAACQLNNIAACNALAYNLSLGLGAKKDTKKAVKLFNQTQTLGSELAGFSLKRLQSGKNPMNYKTPGTPMTTEVLTKFIVSVYVNRKRVSYGFYLSNNDTIVTSDYAARSFTSKTNNTLLISNSETPEQRKEALLIKTYNTDMLALIKIYDTSKQKIKENKKNAPHFQALQQLKKHDAVTIIFLNEERNKEIKYSKIIDFYRAEKMNLIAIDLEDCSQLTGNPLFLKKTGQIIGIGVDVVEKVASKLQSYSSQATENNTCFFMAADYLNTL